MLPAKEHGPVRAIGVRVFVAVMCVVITTTVVYLERADYRDLEGTIDSWLDALYYATVTLSTTGYGDITPVSESARLTNILIITPLRFVFLIVLVGTTIEVLTERSRQQFRTNRWRKRVKKHTVVIGYGMKGRSAVSALIDQGYPADHIVVVDPDGANIKAATADGCVGVLGDARREEVLRQAAVPERPPDHRRGRPRRHQRAGHADRRRLAPTATIAAAAREEQNIAVLRQGGADVVIPTAESAGRLLGLSIIAPNAGEVIEDLLEPVAGLQISEREVRPGGRRTVAGPADRARRDRADGHPQRGVAPLRLRWGQGVPAGRPDRGDQGQRGQPRSRQLPVPQPPAATAGHGGAGRSVQLAAHLINARTTGPRTGTGPVSDYQAVSPQEL